MAKVDFIAGRPLPNPWTRAIPQPAENLTNLVACVAALKETVESLIGQRGRPPNRAVTFNDLITLGVLTPEAVSSPDGSFVSLAFDVGPGLKLVGTNPPVLDVATPYLPLTGGTITGDLTVNGTPFFGNALRLTGPDVVGGGNSTYGRLAPNRWLLRHAAGDDSSAGIIDYRGFDPAALSIVGAGTAGGNRLVRLWDNLTTGNATFTGGLTVAGSSAFAGMVTAPTPAGGTNNTTLATTAFVNSAIAAGGGAFLPLTGGTLAGPGNLAVGGTLGVTGDATFAGSLGVDGNLNVTTALLRLLGADFAGGGATNTARFAPNRWIFRQTVGDDTNAGAIDYRGYDAGSLSIVGAGTTAGSRLIRLLDNVVIPGTLSVIGATTLATATATTPATANNSTLVATTAFVKAQGYLAGNQAITLSGDASGTGTTAIPIVLATVNANVGTFQGLTLDAKGRVIAAANQNYATTATLAGYLPLTGGTISGALTVTGITTMGNWLALNGADLVGSGRTTEARLAPNRLLFRQPAGDEPSAGTIDYRGYDPGALSIVGAGTAGGNRLIRLFDNLVIPGTLAVSGATTLATATATTPATADNSTNVATTAFVKAQGYATTAALAGYLPLTGGTISGTLGVGGAAQACLYVFGATQATPAINTAGVLPYLMLDDANFGVGSGGGIIFSSNTGLFRFGAIVGYATSGGNNSQGDIVFSTRRIVTDATLTEAMRIRSDGVALHKAPVICTSIGSPPIGQFHMAGNPAGTGYGSFWYNDGSFTYLLLTANNDALGSYNSLRPFMVDNATGLVAIGHGVNITGLTQILSSSATNVLKIQNAGGQNLQIFDDTNEHIEASNVLWINGNTHVPTNFGGNIAVQGTSASTGGSAGFQFDDRTGTSPTNWVLYATGGKATLYNPVNGDVFSVGVAGALTTKGNVNGANNKYFFWADTTGAFKQGFGMSSDNNYYISDGARYIILNGWTVPIADNTMKCGEPSRAWNIVQSYAFTNSSDRRLKRDIEALPADCLGLVRAIDPVQFRWRQGLDSDRQHWGFVAQDVGAAMKAAGIDFGGHVIGDDPDATEALSVTEMIAVLWRAVQELAGA